MSKGKMCSRFAFVDQRFVVEKGVVGLYLMYLPVKFLYIICVYTSISPVYGVSNR